MRQIKLLFVVRQLYRGGLELSLINLLKTIDKIKYGVTLLVLDQTHIGNLESLTGYLPKEVNLWNAAASENAICRYIRKAGYNLWEKLTGRMLVRPEAKVLLKRDSFDVAFSFGEWLSPCFVAKYADACDKYVWVHTDIDKLKNFHAKRFFAEDNAYRKYIFVSQNSRRSAESKYAQLRGKSAVVCNLCDDAQIEMMSQQRLPAEFEVLERPILLTVGNVREEKNHHLQIKVHEKLQQMGIDVTWLNIGGLSHQKTVREVRLLIEAAGLSDRFLLLGSDDNPYRYMVHADVICVLSRFESWSMVITEAKVLGVPIIATKTSGAVEQLEHLRTGILVEWDPEEIASHIKMLLQTPDMKKKLRNNLKDFNSSQDSISSFYSIIENKQY